MIKFNKVHIKNFLSIEDSEVTLDRGGFVKISGINENPDDNAASNGAGKSSITETIIWSITGETIRGTKDVKRFNSDGPCEVTLDFDVNGDNYVITRTKDPSNLFIYINGENKSGKGIRDSEKLLREYLPDVTAQLLGSVVVMGQGLPMRFSNNTPSGRKDVLEKLSKSDFMIEDIKDRVSSRKTALSTLKRDLEDSILRNNTIISSKTAEATRHESEFKGLQNATYDDILSEKRLRLDSTNTEIDKLLEANKDLSNKVSLKKDEIIKLTKDRSAECDTVRNSFSDSIMGIRAELADLMAKEREIFSQINAIKNIKTHCPTCGQPLQGVEKPDPAPLEKKLAEQKALTNQKTLELNDLTDKQSEKLAEISSKYTSTESKLNNELADLQRQISSVNSQYSSLVTTSKSIQSEINTIELQKKNHEYKLEQLRTAIKECKQAAESAQIEVNNKTIELEKDKAHLDVINKFENALKRDFRGILLENIIKYIDMKAKEYSKIVFETDKLDFKLDGNNISISYCGKEYENLSGGERAKVDIIIQLALRSMLCKYLNFTSNILVMDEVFDNLDFSGSQKVLELFTTALEDVSTIYIISHHQDLAMPFDHELIIVKNSEGVSNVRNN